MDLNFFLSNLEATLGIKYTDEQVEFFKDFTSPVISFSDPGTGKTQSTVAGLLATEMVHKIPASRIFACSFTREATNELKYRHKETCKKLQISSRVQFRTIDALCKEIVVTYGHMLNLPAGVEVDKFKVVNRLSLDIYIPTLQAIAEDNEIILPSFKYRQLVNAITTLNSSLIFDEEHVKNKSAFKLCRMPYHEFNTFRREIYLTNKILGEIPVGDLSLYALEILTNNPSVRKKYKELYDVMVVDEFQDMSLLKLHLLSLITNNLVVVGDVKQQIYGFTGACDEIVEKYREYFPHRKEVHLTQSFRCPGNVAELSKIVIAPNKMGGETFKGTGYSDSDISISNDFDFVDFAKRTKEDYMNNGNMFSESIMFLYRSVYQAIPLFDALYKYQVPFIAVTNQNLNGYTEAHKLPVIRDLIELVELAKNPKSVHKLGILNKIFGELKEYKEDQYKSPIYKIMMKTKQPVYDIQYQFKYGDVWYNLMQTLKRVNAMLENREPIAKVFNEVYKPYKKTYLSYMEKYLEQPASYYTNLVAPLIVDKTYDQFVSNEIAKAQYVKECYLKGSGIRCLTFHRSKGTESDTVHILGAEEGLVPSESHLEEYKKNECFYDAAVSVRNERSLMYVAVTRAKKNLHIHFNKTITSLLQERNDFLGLDNVYESTINNYKDVEVFEEFFKEV